MMSAMRSITLVLFSVAFALGCPPSERKEAPSGPGACARVGQTCELAPGKLGTCVMKEGCSEAVPSCFDCQSQH